MLQRTTTVYFRWSERKAPVKLNQFPRHVTQGIESTNSSIPDMSALIQNVGNVQEWLETKNVLSFNGDWLSK